jgi:CDP-diacylglycerol--glycerol-3-phosphate 3-phosphatidyltransferase
MIPWLLVWLRLLLTPCFIIGYFVGAPGWLYVVMLLVGILSDIFDGVLARRWGTSTPALRRFDSNTDTLFYGCSGLTAVLLNAAYLRPWWLGLLLMFGLMFAQNVLNGIRYRVQPSYHFYSGKLWSIVLVVTLSGLFLKRPLDWAIDGNIVLGIYNSVEGIIASLILSRPVTDIPTVFHAVKIARAENGNNGTRPEGRDQGQARG